MTTNSNNIACKNPIEISSSKLVLVASWRHKAQLIQKKVMDTQKVSQLDSLSQWTLKKGLNFIFPTKYGIPQSLKPVSHWLSKLITL